MNGARIRFTNRDVDNLVQAVEGYLHTQVASGAWEASPAPE